MAVKIGISPIAWQNDDLPDLTAAYTMEQALSEAREIGYSGVERGRRMPHDTEGLRDYLRTYDIALCGGWCSGNLMADDVATEIANVGQQVAQFVALGAPCLVYAECSNTVQGDIATPVSHRPKLTRDEIAGYGAKLTEVARWMADQGMTLAYHHHMGSMIEDGEDIDWLMETTGPEVTLLYDTGHLRFGGADVMGVLDRWGDRISHVHFKDVRAEVTARMRAENRSFLDAVIAGAFTVPGDPEGSIDFQAVADRLRAMDYEGWIVVEAEQDPSRADPKAYSKMGYDHIVDICARAGITIDG
ncbi:myo-inosose-2 dehydratase [Ponticoccus sp. SC2-23]|uniref:myo-inosose-2 dehydratase n=1 Tax=Alexandriicola marinus TaxID=2081710 RepID=UPI000FDB123F|nr:myo-inosose-2 dehydratase [Alexandriicola marinus]MBM1219061.1 myo-inosose-2 dehydratase [Ponticoccus sp. SC6-9]MBM1223867.1 myo-inosose-2 dehydratase [Ponticoccus sp. SC6-15]MBM1228875.1 myo-inosose-2 dehydratase [Ponticoccus sp. SC6-38]MBM1232833.1 myo-inosose-2 dehydratase [Ponticoccus sp. SC6-45]MBM1237217.1 myo-inosose-2 dehydratase [Ponticoccus sp. SC6-49]MBM1241844.1 myo-inosose-2 dehydratase [Ponticoccus sp. SC2-64]MBM1246357.1 myo-inosose-2 dehydratase [Ponticoccus sp. SC6-42]MB